jgi:hypothetical protein
MFQHSLVRFICIVVLLFASLSGNSHAQPTGAAVTGNNATAVTVTERGKARGEFRKINSNTWIEVDARGVAVYQYEEVRHDDAVVHLADGTRDVTIQIDLRKRTVLFLDLSVQRREVYQIKAASDGPFQAMPSNVSVQTAPAVAVAAPAKGKAAAPAKGKAAPVAGFCWNDSVTRGAGSVPGRIADCPEGYTLSGGSCKRPASTVAAASRAADCPAGYNNTGNSCERPAQTKPNANSRLADCPKDYENTGGACFRLSASTPLDMSKMSCKAGETRIEARCFKACETGFNANGTSCTRPASTLGAENLACKSGFTKNSKTGRCTATCAAGFTNNGEACVRAADTLGVESMVCKAGETRNGSRCLPAGGMCGDGEVQQGELCYKACAAGYEGIGSVCFKQPPKAWLACGTGSAKDEKACAGAVLEPGLALRQAAALVQAAGTSRLGKERASTKKKFLEMNEAYNKAKNLPQFKKGLEAWAAADSARVNLDTMASVTTEEDMVRYAVQLAQIADLAGVATDDAAYPKCSALPPTK